MKRKTDYPEYEEHKSFRLKNEHRHCFGIDEIDKKWDEIHLNERITVFYDNDIIRKVIEWDNHVFYSYREYDTELKTRNREFILPITSKGKEKKTTPSNILSFKPTGCAVYFSLNNNSYNSNAIVYNPRNNIRLPMSSYDRDIKTIDELETWIDNYINTLPQNHFDKVKRMKNTLPRVIKYKVGDIFRFELDQENYGFGIIIGKLNNLKKMNIFSKHHPMLSTLTVPIITRLYLIKTPDKDISLNELFKYELMPAHIMVDYEILKGTHEIIGNKTLEEDDIDFPIQCCYRRDENNNSNLYFAWGFAMKCKVNVLNIPDYIINRNFENTGVAFGLNTYILEKALAGESIYHPLSNFSHPDNLDKKIEIFELLELPIDIDYDCFNRKYGGMTRKDYIEFIETNYKNVK